MTDRDPKSAPIPGLYGRAVLLVAVGSGALVGALGVWGELVARDARARLLDARERDARIMAESFRPSGSAEPEALNPRDLDATLRSASGHEEGALPGSAVIADARGRVVVASTHAELPPDVRAMLDLPRRGERSGRAVVPIAGRDTVVAWADVPATDRILIWWDEAARVLAPARAWRLRAFGLGVAVVLLFLTFNWLSVHSLAAPIRRLTAALRRAEAADSPLTAVGFGRDEVGELATALAHWQRRVGQSLAQAAATRDELERESEAIGDHLTALRAISDVSTSQDDLQPLLSEAVRHVTARFSAPGGALRLVRGGRRAEAHLGVAPERARRWLDLTERAHSPTTSPRSPDSSALEPTKVHAPEGRVWGLALSDADGLRVSAVVLEPALRRDDSAFWASSLLRHVAMCASHLFLRELDRDRRQQQGEYLRRVMRAQEDERSRVARDLHDTVAQDLAALRLEAERLAVRAQRDPALADQLSDFEDRAREMLETVRRILLDLRSSVLESLGFVPAVKWLLERLERENGLKPRLLVDGDEELEYDSAIMLFRIVQEALLNVAQHARAERVFVSIRMTPSEIELDIEDDGVGFDPLRRRGSDQTSRGLGILGMEERAQLLGGELHIASRPTEGTSIRVHIPRRLPAASERRAEAS